MVVVGLVVVSCGVVSRVFAMEQAQADSAKRVVRLAQVAHNAFRKHGRLTY